MSLDPTRPVADQPIDQRVFAVALPERLAAIDDEAQLEEGAEAEAAAHHLFLHTNTRLPTADDRLFDTRSPGITDKLWSA